jgi:hypothetical protein
VTKVGQLEQQNKALREELLTFKRSNLPLQTPNPNRHDYSHDQALSTCDGGQPSTPLETANVTPSLQRSIERSRIDIDNLSHADMLAEYRTLDGKYQKTRSQLSNLITANGKLRSRLRDKTNAYQHWMAHAEVLDKQLQARNKRIDKLKSKLAEESGLPHAGSSFGSDADPIDRNDGRGPDVPDAAEFGDGPSLPPLPINDTAVSDQSPVKQEPSSDTPVIITERSVHKRKLQGGGQQTASPARIKLEGSDPLLADEQRRFMPHESIDFDDAEEDVATPRRKRHSHRNNGTAISPLNFISVRTNALQRADAALLREEETSQQEMDGTAGEEPEVDQGASIRRSSALLPMDVNCVHPRGTARKRRSKAVVSQPLAPGIENLAEDSDNDDSPRPNLQKRIRSGRLEALLESAPQDRPAIALPGGASTRAKPADIRHIDMPQKRNIPFPFPFGKIRRNNINSVLESPNHPVAGSTRRSWNTFQPKSKKSLGDQQPMTPSAETGGPLRQRPEKLLTIYDFKPNPKYTEGLGFAFTDVVRRKQDRECMQGCVKESCCGPIWRTHAKAARENTGVLEFQSLLETWLGDEAWKLSTMSPSEKETLWLRAKMQELANKHGKAHRDIFHPMGSPPGLWRTDFPSTQESMLDREEARERETEMVQERRREALKPNGTGRFLFRDE